LSQTALQRRLILQKPEIPPRKFYNGEIENNFSRSGVEMKLKGLAVFSIALMAIVAAPQAARDFRGILIDMAERADTAFLQAVLNSHQGRTSAQPVDSTQRPASVCSNSKPAPPESTETAKPAQSPAARALPRAATQAHAPMRLEIHVPEVAKVEIPSVKDYVDPIEVSFDQDDMAQQILLRVANKGFATTEGQRKLTVKCKSIHNLLKSLSTWDKPDAMKQWQRSTPRTPWPGIKADFKQPLPPVLAAPSPAPVTVKLVAFVDTQEAAGADGE
jgi:hypothetical protein